MVDINVFLRDSGDKNIVARKKCLTKLLTPMHSILTLIPIKMKKHFLLLEFTRSKGDFEQLYWAFVIPSKLHEIQVKVTETTSYRAVMLHRRICKNSPLNGWMFFSPLFQVAVSMLSKLPLNVVYNILNYLCIDDLVQVSQSSKKCKEWTYQLYYVEPTLIPLRMTQFPLVQQNIRSADNVSTAKTFWKHKWNTFEIKALPENYAKKRATLLNVDQSESAKNTLLNDVSIDTIPPIFQEWMGSCRDLSIKFNGFRQRCIKHLKSQPLLNNPIEALSLNHILLVSFENATLYNIEHENWIGAVVESKKYITNGVLQEVNSDIIKMIEKVSNTCKMSIHMAKEELSTYKELRLYQDENERNAVDMLDKLLNYLNYDWNTSKMGEHTFITKVVEPIISSFFQNSNSIELYGSDHVLQESSTRKTKVAMSNNQPTKDIRGRVADFSGLIKKEGPCSHHAFVVEVKTQKSVKHRPDLVKMGSLMKDCLDGAILHGRRSDEYAVFGLLIEGRDCTIYAMDLPVKKMYRMVEIDTFFLPVHIKDLNALVSVYRGMSLFCNLINKYVNNFNNENCAISQNDSYITRSCSSPQYHVSYYT
ncbi:hypothetical protein K501DRAFT_330649 [Backusella circina FSU 941]|nr:hypothetical protein K501DRAFT_330649 [Backusella circina FSU 941]